MSDIETKVDKLDERVSSLERQVSTTMAKVDTIIGEMRDRDNQRVEDMREIRKSLDGIREYLNTMTIISISTIGAIVITVIISLIKG